VNQTKQTMSGYNMNQSASTRGSKYRRKILYLHYL